MASERARRPRVTDEEPVAALECAVVAFDAGRYKEALDQFEVPYHAAGGDARGLYLGLVRAAAALHHFVGGRPASARRLHRLTEETLSGLPDLCEGFDLGHLRGELERLFGPLHAAADDVADTLRPASRPRLERR